MQHVIVYKIQNLLNSVHKNYLRPIIFFKISEKYEKLEGEYVEGPKISGIV